MSLISTGPLDLKYIFVNILSGSPIIFFLLAMIVVAYMASRYRMTNQIVLIFIALFIVMMAGFFGQHSLAYGFYLIVVLISGLIFYLVLSKFFK